MFLVKLYFFFFFLLDFSSSYSVSLFFFRFRCLNLSDVPSTLNDCWLTVMIIITILNKIEKCEMFSFFFLFFCLVWLVGRCCDYNYLVVHTFVHTMTRAFNIRTWHNHHLYSMHTHRINLNWTNIRTHQKRRKNSQCGSHSQESEARIASDREREYREEKKIIKKKKRTEFTFFVVAFFFPCVSNKFWLVLLFYWCCCLSFSLSRSIEFAVDFSFAVAYTFFYLFCLFGRLVRWLGGSFLDQLFRLLAVCSHSRLIARFLSDWLNWDWLNIYLLLFIV